MSGTPPSIRETRPLSQPSRDQLVLQVENVALAGRRLLAIEIFEVQNAAQTKATGTPSSPLHSTSPPSTPSSSSARASCSGFRVAARDEVENEYSLFVTRQKAEYLYRAAYPVEAAASEMISSEAMANGILAHLSIIGNRQRGVGKLVCREPEAHVEKKTRLVPAITPPNKQRNPHLPSKRQDQRAVRVQKTSKRAMEAVAQAMRRPDSDLSGDDESAGSEMESGGKQERKGSEASLLHRMAVADSKTMWKAELETNYEESDHGSFSLEDDMEINSYTQQYALPPGLSPVKRALPERKTKHKDLEERRQKGRHQRIMVTQAAQEAPSSALLGSVQAENPYSDVIEETEQDAEFLSSDASRRSSIATVSSTEKPITQPRASSAPRSSVVVGTAYSLKNLYEYETTEPEQFLRRRTLDAHRSVLRTDSWQDDILGMGIEITDERPSLITPPNRLDALLSTARRVLVANAVGSTLQRSASSVTVVSEKENSRCSTSPTISLYSAVLGASHSEPALQSPKIPKAANDCLTNAEPEEYVPTTKPLTSDENTAGDRATGEQMKTTAKPSVKKRVRPRSKSTSTKPGIVTSNAMTLASPEKHTTTLLPGIVPPVLPSTTHQMTLDSSVSAHTSIRPRSNSVGSERIVRLSPLSTTINPPVQEFLAAAEPVATTLMTSTREDDITSEKEVLAPPSDPEIVLCPSSGLITEVNKAFSAETSKEGASDLPVVDGPSSPQYFEEVLLANANSPLPAAIDTGIEKSEPIEASNDVAVQLAKQDVDRPLTSRQACWEEPTTTTLSELLVENTYDSMDGDVRLVMKEEVPDIARGLQSSPLEHGPSEAIVAEANSSVVEKNTELQVVADDFIVGEGDYQNRNGDEEMSGDMLHEILVIQEGVGSINTVLQGHDTNENTTPDSIDAANSPSIAEELIPQGVLEKSCVNNDDNLIDANSGEIIQAGADSFSEDRLHIHAASEIDSTAWKVAVTAQEITGISSEFAVDSTERIQDKKVVTARENCFYPEETTEEKDTHPKHSYQKIRAQMPVVDDIGHSERVEDATTCVGNGDFAEDIGSDESINKRKLDADTCSCGSSEPNDTSSQPTQPHQTRSLDTERKNADTTVLVAEGERGQEQSGRQEEFVQNVAEEADNTYFHKTIVGLPLAPTYDEENYAELQDGSQSVSRNRTDTLVVTPAQPDIEVSSEKTSIVSRKKSMSPGKKTSSTSKTTQGRPASKGVGSRRISTVLQVLDAQAEVPPTLQFERRHTAGYVKRRGKDTRRMSTLEQNKPLPGLASSTTTMPIAKEVPVEKGPDEVLRVHNKRHVPTKRQSSQSGSSQNVSNYHKKWGKWMVGRSIIEKVGCLQLEDLVIANPRDEENLLKLGLRYTKWPGTSLPGILIVEHAVLLQKTPSGSQDYWFWLGSAHLDIFMRHRKYLPIARFHLSKSIWAFTSAFAYMESLVDPMRLLRYAIGLFWHKGDGNLEKTRDICHELFSRFVSFCDKDLPNLLFLQFQVFHRLKHYMDAIECMNRILDLHERLSQQVASSLSSTNDMAHFSVYDAADYRLMLMQCQQASGDYVSAALTLATVLKLKGVQQDTTLKDEEYFDLWCSLAEKSFHHEDYTLALEYYAIALNFAKQSQVLAAIHYNLGLCFQSLGEDNKCVTEYKRARTANRHVSALVSLAELSIPYDERFALLLQKPVVQIIEEVRVELYGRAVKRLQRVFRSRRNLNVGVDSNSSDSPLTKMPSLSKRRLSIAAARNPSVFVKTEDTANETEASEEKNFQQKPVVVGDNQVTSLEVSPLDFAERRHEVFLARKQVAMEEMAQLLMNTQYRGRETSPTSHPKAGMQLRSGMLSPEKDCLDVRRKQSMEAFRQLGYVSSTMPWIEFWEKLLVLAPELYESRQALYGSIARIRARLPLVTDEVAFCALAESVGNVHEAAEKLHDASYERELTYVCAVIEVAKQLERDFPLESTQLSVKAPHVSLPTISSPRADHSSAQSPVDTSRRVVLPPYSPTRVKTASISKPTKHLRMNQMLNLHFQEHVQQQEAAIAITEATGGFVQRHRRMEKLMVLHDFRKTNDALLRSQMAFGSEKAAT